MIQKEFAHRMIDQLFEIRETMQAKLIALMLVQNLEGHSV
jgi:hypothetical protein